MFFFTKKKYYIYPIVIIFVLFFYKKSFSNEYRSENSIDINTANSVSNIFTMYWSSLESENTTSVAWGDVDNDGDLDLATGNHSRPVRLYRNNNGQLSPRAFWQSSISDRTTSIAWGDIDNDGYLDLAVGNLRGPERVYMNKNGILDFQPSWSSNDIDDTVSVAWGDINSDGYLDLAVGNGCHPFSGICQVNKIYRNNQGVLNEVIWQSSELDDTNSIAWGDYDRDNDLDLVVANRGQPNRIYTNDNGNLSNSASWSSMHARDTLSVAWGDLDNDGDLDLAFGNNNQSSEIFINTNSNFSPEADWTSLEKNSTTSITWCDYDNDGDLDLVITNGGTTTQPPYQIYANINGVFDIHPFLSSDMNDRVGGIAWGDYDNDGDLDFALATYSGPNRILRNEIGMLDSTSSWASSTSNDTLSIAWGDVDNDGDLDLAAGNMGKPTQLYRNNDGNLESQSVWSTTLSDFTNSIAWGDVDNDGDLDLAVGNYGQPNKLYENIHGSLSATPAWTASLSDLTSSIAWADYDNDGDLDLAVGNIGTVNTQNSGQPERLYQNNNGTLSQNPVWSSPHNDMTNEIAWGDVDNDGDLDLAVANGCQLFSNTCEPSRLYRNDRGTFAQSSMWTSSEQEVTSSLAWGDVDGDGDLDLALGGQLNRLYINTNGQLSTLANWTSLKFEGTSSIAWADYDNDGDLDLTASNGNQPNSIYKNDYGILSLEPVWLSSDISLAKALSWADMDRDGDLDLAVGSSNRPIKIYRNNRNNQSNPAIFSIAINNPNSISEADGNSSAFIFDTPTIAFTYTLYNNNSLDVEKLQGFFSLNGGGSWLPAVATTGTITTHLETEPYPTITDKNTHVYIWDVWGSGVMGQSETVLFRLDVISPSYIMGISHGVFGKTLSSTALGRLRGSQVRVLFEDGPSINTLIYHRQQNQFGQMQPYSDLANKPFVTDTQGYLQGRGQIRIGDDLVAVMPVTTTNSYSLFYTNAPATYSGITSHSVTQLGVQTLIVSASNPLILLNLDVSLEWDARQDTAYLANLNYQLQRTAELLYDWTNGQVTLGQIRIFHDRNNWDNAHIRIYATNRLRPNAAQGGIVTTPISDPLHLTIAYEPGQVHMGSIWNRYGDPTSTLADDWARTLAHELGHYALFLDDNYLGLDNQGHLINIESCPGAMADPYRADYYSEFHPTIGWLPACEQTLSQHETGRSDWNTIQTFYPWLHGPTVPITATNPGPSRLPLAVTTIHEQLPITPTITIPVPIFYLVTADGSRYQPSPTARAFLFHNTRVTDIGQPTLDQVTARGARIGDRLCVFDLKADHSGCAELIPNQEHLVMLPDPTWHPQLVVTPITSRTLTLSVTAIPVDKPILVQIFPVDAPATSSITMTQVPGGATAIITLPDSALEGIIHLWIDNPSDRREIVTDYAIGGNPGHRRARIGHRRARITPVLSPDGQALLFGPDLNLREGEFYTLQTATNLPAVPSWATIVGTGYWLSGSPTAPNLQGSSLSISYLGNAIARDDEQWLRLYHWEGQQWRPLDTTVDTYYNTAVAPTVGSGLYVLLASIELPLPTVGWNLMAYPSTTSAVTTALDSIANSYTMVYGYEPRDEADPWKVYAPAAPQWVNDLQDLAFGRGYWIYTTKPVTLHVPLESNERLLSETAIEQLNTQLPPMTIYGYVTTTHEMTSTIGLDVEAMIGGMRCGTTKVRTVPGGIGYVLAVEAASDRITGCGMLARPVMVRIVSETMLGAVTAWDDRRVWSLDVHGAPYTVYIPLILLN